MLTRNQIELAGNLCGDPEIKYLGAKNTPLCTFNLAVNSRIKKGEEWVDDPVFVEVSIWGKKAEVIGESGHKGTNVVLFGRLKMDQWEKDGKKFSKLKVEASDIDIIQPTNHGDRSSQAGRTEDEYPQTPPRRGKQAAKPDESDIPF